MVNGLARPTGANPLSLMPSVNKGSYGDDHMHQGYHSTYFVPTHRLWSCGEGVCVWKSRVGDRPNPFLHLIKPNASLNISGEDKV
jgi:hypothetical protein